MNDIVSHIPSMINEVFVLPTRATILFHKVNQDMSLGPEILGKVGEYNNPSIAWENVNSYLKDRTPLSNNTRLRCDLQKGFLKPKGMQIIVMNYKLPWNTKIGNTNLLKDEKVEIRIVLERI
ncbi:MAG: hypothetical protein WC471_00995 [Candidatus Woesearchaeota archaeon]